MWEGGIYWRSFYCYVLINFKYGEYFVGCICYVDESMAQKSITEVPHTQMMRGPHTHHYVLGLHIMF